MKLNKTNMKHADGTCPYCQNSESILFDEFHGETYCSKCGLVLHSPTRSSIVELIREAKEKEKEFHEYLNSLVVPFRK